MAAKADVDAAIDGYHASDLNAVLIGSDIWPQFLAETGLKPVPLEGNDVEVQYRGVSCRPSVTPNAINLLVGS